MKKIKPTIKLSDSGNLHIHIPMFIRRMRGRKMVFTPSSYVARTLKLTTLAPDIIEAIINGEEPSGLSLSKLVKTFPLDWSEQRTFFGFS